jgi:hypothetical protein
VQTQSRGFLFHYDFTTAIKTGLVNQKRFQNLQVSAHIGRCALKYS